VNKDALLYPLRNTQDTEHDTALWNWAQNSVVGQRQQLHQPQTEAELQQLLRDTRGKVRLVGSRLSPGRMLCVQPDDLLLDLSAFTGVVAEDDNSITFAAGTLLQEVYDTLTARDRMLASSPGVIAVQTLAGALATGAVSPSFRQRRLHWVRLAS